MDKEGLLRSIAETGYNVGFGAKKHFATYDIVEKMPGIIGFLSLAIGIFSLVFDQLSAKVPSAILTVAGVMALYISLYDHDKGKYERVGKELTRLFNQLRDLYRSVQAGLDPAIGQEKLGILESAYYEASIIKQIVVADWYAHYKFFAQHQIDWIHEQKKFTWRDKIPMSLLFTLGGLAVVAIVWWVAVNWQPGPPRTLGHLPARGSLAYVELAPLRSRGIVNDTGAIPWDARTSRRQYLRREERTKWNGFRSLLFLCNHCYASTADEPQHFVA